MSKRHFEKIAATIAATLKSTEGQDEAWGITVLAFNLADDFATFNPSFDKERFLRAAGVR